MDKLNEVEIETAQAIKSFELWHGDIAEIPGELDLLVISSVNEEYWQFPGTLITALMDRFAISVEELAKTPDFDLRKVLNCWISKPMPHGPFRRLM